MNKSEVARQYLELLKKSLLNELYVENEARLIHTFVQMLHGSPLGYGHYLNIRQTRADIIDALLEYKMTGASTLLQVEGADGNPKRVPGSRNLTELSHTMIGRKRLDNIQYCLEAVLRDGVAGDFIETGIWRGGACIFAEAVLVAHDATDRIVWAADSFEGVPPPTLPEDKELDISASVLPVLAVSLDEVQDLFRRYGLLRENVRFLKGWFKDTLATAPIEQLAVLRLDGDLYESTMDALVPLYDKVAPGGFVIVDDYNSCPPCKRAIEDFREQRGIADEMQVIDAQSVYWRKS